MNPTLFGGFRLGVKARRGVAAGASPSRMIGINWSSSVPDRPPQEWDIFDCH